MSLLYIHQDTVIIMKFLSVALQLTCVCLWSLALTTICQTSTSLLRKTHFIAAKVGDTVTIQCFLDNDFSTLFYWYKQSLGQEPRLISTFYSLHKKITFQEYYDKEGRFTLDTELNKHHLIINNSKTSDSATYYCCSGYAYSFMFKNGTFVSVKGSDGKSLIFQSPSQTAQSGDSLTLNCTFYTGSCGGEHYVYWFRDSGESHPGLIYTQGGSNDQCGSKNDTQTQTCEYNLAMESLNASHTGTYYCAVASCGHMLFGNGTQVDIKGENEDFLASVYVLSVASAVTTLLCVCLALRVCTMTAADSCLCGDTAGRTSTPAETMDDQNPHDSTSVWKNKQIRRRRQKDDTWTECLYFSECHDYKNKIK